MELLLMEIKIIREDTSLEVHYTEGYYTLYLLVASS